MLLFPEAQKKAQQELDRVVGADRLPDLSDENELPYITAIMKEVFRWAILLPLGWNPCLDHTILNYSWAQVWDTSAHETKFTTDMSSPKGPTLCGMDGKSLRC